MSHTPRATSGPSAKQREVVGEWLMALREMQSNKRDIDWIALAHNIAEAVIANTPRSEIAPKSPTSWRDQVEGAMWDENHSGHYILARDMAAILDRQALPSATRTITTDESPPWMNISRDGMPLVGAKVELILECGSELFGGAYLQADGDWLWNGFFIAPDKAEYWRLYVE